MADDQKAIDDGRRATEILNDDVFKQAVANARQKIIETWEAATSAEAREKAHSKLAALSAVVAELGAQESTGQVAQHKLNRAGRTRY